MSLYLWMYHSYVYFVTFTSGIRLEATHLQDPLVIISVCSIVLGKRIFPEFQQSQAIALLTDPCYQAKNIIP